MTFKYEDAQAKTLSPQTRKDLAERIKQDIDAWCIKEFTGEHRDHLGASIIGHDCIRFIWYTFRWVKFNVFDGRMLRLFNRGHLEEQRFIKWLRGIKCEVWEVDPATNKQFRIWGVSGHYGGSADSVGKLPYFPDLPMLMEFKTHNDKSFTALKNKGLVLTKYDHYSQMNAYGKHYNFKYGLYCAVNKNDDELYFEVVELNWNTANTSLMTASEIVNAKAPPQRISEQPSYYKCKWCHFNGICHNNEPVEINCRSCKFATAVEGAEWHCSRFNSIIPKDYLIKGCPGHVSINSP